MSRLTFSRWVSNLRRSMGVIALLRSRLLLRMPSSRRFPPGTRPIFAFGGTSRIGTTPKSVRSPRMVSIRTCPTCYFLAAHGPIRRAS